MQEYNSETDIKRRRLSDEPVSTVVSMSGDTPYRQTFKKNGEETDLLVLDGTKSPPAPSIGFPSDNEKTANAEDKQEFLEQSKEESKEGFRITGDSYEKDSSNDYLENKESLNKASDATWQKNKGSDKVGSVFLQPSLPHKARSTASTIRGEDCSFKCLYYTILCCDCVIM